MLRRFRFVEQSHSEIFDRDGGIPVGIEEQLVATNFVSARTLTRNEQRWWTDVGPIPFRVGLAKVELLAAGERNVSQKIGDEPWLVDDSASGGRNFETGRSAD
jgi:hypothetical protein